MLNLLWLVPTLPLISFIVLAVFGKRLGKLGGFIGTASLGITALLTIIIGIGYLSSPPDGNFYEQTLWTWFSIKDFAPEIALYLDPMALVFIFVITFVGFLIHWYSMEYMEGDEGYSRFFAYMNLFVCSMLLLVLGNDLLLVYLGWEGVGLCSYLLIGFWYKNPFNNFAARKAFIVTRIGDTAMLIGLFLLVKDFGTLNIQDILTQAPDVYTVGGSSVSWAAVLLLAGAIGKSAQLPLHTWLPDAMAGPTPVSALIHAATMVTAGVYLIARTNVLFEMAPAIQMLVAIIGAATLIIAGLSALAQRDIKKVLAYSTISQIGYMFVALGVGAWSAGIFHFMIHAFFKALLFLGAGAVILAMHHEQDMFKMGGLRKKIPVVFWTFLFGSAALAALPLVTAGFYSKDEILFLSLASTKGSVLLWICGFIGAFITALYTFRMVFITFYGKAKMEVEHKPRMSFKIPLIILGVLSLVAGFIQLPESWGHFHLFSDLLSGTLPTVEIADGMHEKEIWLQLLTAAVAIAGVWIAYVVYVKRRKESYAFEQSGLYNFFFQGWKFDQLYDVLFVKPTVWLSKIDKHDFIDKIYCGIGNVNLSINKAFSRTQNGYLKLYVGGLAVGTIVALMIALFL